MTTLIFAPTADHAVTSSTLEAITCAQAFSDPIHILCPSLSDDAIKVLARIEGVHTVHYLPDDAVFDGIPETITICMQHIGATALIAASNTHSKQHLPKVAAMLDVSMLSDVIAMHDAATFQRPVFAGDFVATMMSHDPILVLSIRPGNFGQPKLSNTESTVTIKPLPSLHKKPLVTYEKNNEIAPKRDLQTADTIISVGRGIGDPSYLKTIEALADTLHAAVGATRTIVDAGWVSNDHQVGQTGKIVAPNLYIAIGLSGAMQHLAGIKDSQHIIAINTNPDAPIMQFADYAYEGDLFEAVGYLLQACHA